MKKAEFFMGANSPNGFFSYYGELTGAKSGYRSYLIKGGPGSGKSGLMKKVAAACEGRDRLIELIHCSSDVSSLDGVILHGAACSIVDATPPHVIEPSCPGGYETVINLCDYIDEGKTETRLEKTVSLQKVNALCHQKCRSLIRCADILMKENAYIAENVTDFEKAKATALRIAEREFGKKGGGAKEHKRLLSAVTNSGITLFADTPRALCNRLYCLNDEYGAAASAILNVLRGEALKNGYEIFSCYCPFSPDFKLEHLLIPELELGFVTRDRYNRFENAEFDRVINYTRFTDVEKLSESKRYLKFNRRLANELISAACEKLQSAKRVHDELEKQYADAVDFKAVTEKTDETVGKITARYK